MSNSSSFSFFESKMGGIPKNNFPPLNYNYNQQQQQQFKMESDTSTKLGHNFVPPAIFDPTTDVNNISNLIASQNQETGGNGNFFDYEYLPSNSTSAAITSSGELFRASDYGSSMYGDILLQDSKFEALRTSEVAASVEDGMMIPSIFSNNGINLSGFGSTTHQVNAIESASNHHYDCSQTSTYQGSGNIHGPLEKLINNVTMKRNFTQTLNTYDPSSNLKVVSELEQSKPKKQKQIGPFFNFHQLSNGSFICDGEKDAEAAAQMKEMMYREAAFRPVNFDVEVVEKPERKNVKTSKDPQTVAARQRREKISEKIRVLQRLVPGGNQLDTASMLEEAANYLKFLKSFVKQLELFGGQGQEMQNWGTTACPSIPMPLPSYLSLEKYPNVNHMSS